MTKNNTPPPTHRQETVFDCGPPDQHARYLRWLAERGELSEADQEYLEKLEAQGGSPTTPDINPELPH